MALSWYEMNGIRQGGHRYDSTMMTDRSAHLDNIAEQLSSLSKKLRDCTDPEERRVLLRQFRSLLGEADKIVDESAAAVPRVAVARHGSQRYVAQSPPHAVFIFCP